MTIKSIPREETRIDITEQYSAVDCYNNTSLDQCYFPSTCNDQIKLALKCVEAMMEYKDTNSRSQNGYLRHLNVTWFTGVTRSSIFVDVINDPTNQQAALKMEKA